MLDRRRNVRDKVLYGGVAEIGGRGATMDCVVRNISEQGACVEIESTARMADKPVDRAQGTLVSRPPDLVPGQQGRPRLPHDDF
jgi:hypothetical protein